ncbi:MAG TPA: molecular chaperone [Steroidobacteraceae bacterium]|nr:molecular chaperone [Steroidobacteraceae bacterium]
MTPRTASVLACAGLWGLSHLALASGLQVSPVSVTLKPAHGVDGITLRNVGTDVVHAQVRVYHWTQQNGVEQLTPSTGLVISPPMLRLGAGDQQLIRVIRAGPPPIGAAAVEDAYRISIDELPVQSTGVRTLQLVLRQLLPVFVEPAGVAAPAPKLQWSLQHEGGTTLLQAINTGNAHAQVADISFLSRSSHRVEVAGGLAGYVLPGATRRWTLKQSPDLAGGGTFEARINGAGATQILSAADRTP